MIPLQAVFPLRMYRQKTAGSGWKMSGGSMSSPICSLPEEPAVEDHFILTLIEALLRTNAVLFVLDPRTPTLRIYRRLCRMCTTKGEDILACVDRFYEEMMKRSEDMKLMGELRTGKITLIWGFLQISLSLMNM